MLTLILQKYCLPNLTDAYIHYSRFANDILLRSKYGHTIGENVKEHYTLHNSYSN